METSQEILWTIKEIELIKELYLEKNLTIKDVAEQLPHRTYAAIKTAIRRFGLVKYKRLTFTDEEAEFLKENYKKLGANKCAKILNRNIGSIAGKALELSLKHKIERLSSKKKDLAIKLLHENKTVPEIAKLLNVHKTTVYRLADSTIRKSIVIDTRPRWTKEEIQILKDNYNVLKKGIVELLPRRTYLQIQKKAWTLKLKSNKNNL